MSKVTKVMSGGYRTREDYSWDSPDDDEGYVWSDEAGGMVLKPVEPKPDTRVTPTGITQTGKSLGLGDINGLFASLNERGQMTAGELPSANKFFSEALPTTPQSSYQGGELEISTKDTGYEVGAPVTKGTKIEGSGVSYQDVPDYEVPETSVPMTTGRDGDDVQEGVSDKPDIAEEVRTIRMNRRNSGRGSRRDPRNRDDGVDEPFGGVSETKGNGMSAERRAARAAFLDPNNKGYGAIRAADRAVGAFHQYDTGGMKIGDDLHYFKDGMSRDARYELRGGKIDSKEAAQAFMNKYLQGFGEAAPTDSPAEPPVSEQTETTITPVPRPKPMHELNVQPSEATEKSNDEYAAMKFKYDPEKNMMVPVE